MKWWFWGRDGIAGCSGEYRVRRGLNPWEPAPAAVSSGCNMSEAVRGSDGGSPGSWDASDDSMFSEDSDGEAEDELLSEGLRKMLFIVEEFKGLMKMVLLPKMMLMLVRYDEAINPWWRLYPGHVVLAGERVRFPKSRTTVL